MPCSCAELHTLHGKVISHANILNMRSWLTGFTGLHLEAGHGLHVGQLRLFGTHPQTVVLLYVWHFEALSTLSLNRSAYW